MDCEAYRDQMLDLLYGEAGEAARRSVEEHQAGCASCRDEMAAFKRPPNQVPGVAGLYLAGGTVHPGAGLPMVCLSAKMAAMMALEELHGR